jgi:hypothetical protein
VNCRGTRIKTRKRNIAAPLDPASFSDAVVQIYLDNGGDLVRRFNHFLGLHIKLMFMEVLLVICALQMLSWHRIFCDVYIS